MPDNWCAMPKQIEAKALFLETVVEHFGDRAGKSRRSTNNEADVRSALSPVSGRVSTWRDCDGLGAIHPRQEHRGQCRRFHLRFRSVPQCHPGSPPHLPRPRGRDRGPVRLLFTSKSNYLARRPVTLRFRIRPWDEDISGPCQCPVDSCEHEGRVVWEDDLTDSRMAEQIWQQIAARNKPRNDVAVQEAEEFLYRVLDQGRQPPEVVFALAKPERITPSALKRAKENLHVAERQGRVSRPGS